MKPGIMYWYILLATSALSISDIRRKSVPVWSLAFMAAGAVFLALWERNVPFAARVFGIITGLVFLLISVLSKEAFGKGDAIVIIIIGAALGFSALGTLLCIGFFFSALGALVLLVMKKRGRKDRIPFLPFLAAGEMMFAVLCLCG